LPDGRIVVVSKSLTHPDSPHKTGAKVGNVFFSGWIIEHEVNSKNARSKVQYVTCVDLKEDLPAWVYGLLIKQQPLLIQRIRKLFA
jgi:hypothetical protein